MLKLNFMFVILIASFVAPLDYDCHRVKPMKRAQFQQGNKNQLYENTSRFLTHLPGLDFSLHEAGPHSTEPFPGGVL